MVGKYTYFAGMRITTNNILIVNNTNSDDNQVLPT